MEENNNKYKTKNKLTREKIQFSLSIAAAVPILGGIIYFLVTEYNRFSEIPGRVTNIETKLTLVCRDQKAKISIIAQHLVAVHTELEALSSYLISDEEKPFVPENMEINFNTNPRKKITSLQTQLNDAKIYISNIVDQLDPSSEFDRGFGGLCDGS